MKVGEYLRSRLADLGLPEEYGPMMDEVLFMSRYKYDNYELYKPGRRFLPHLISWLQQFPGKERPVMLKLVQNLTYISEREMQSLAVTMFRRICQELLDEIIVTENLNDFDYNRAYSDHLKGYMGDSLFIGMSDGSRVGYFRRHSRILPRDSVLEYYKIDEWEKKKLADKRFAFLIDDFCGSGITFLREEEHEGKTSIEGQLPRFLERWGDFVHFERIFYCPYIITQKAYSRLTRLTQGPNKIIDTKARFNMLYSMMIPDDHSCIFGPSRIFSPSDLERIKRICDVHYVNFEEDENLRKGGGCRYGFGETGLAIVLYHNSPNNCIYVIWNTSKNWQPLFPRIPKHK